MKRKPAALKGVSPAVYAGIELACLDLMGRATGLRLCELLGGPVRDRVEFCSYLLYCYAELNRIVCATAFGHAGTGAVRLKAARHPEGRF